MRVSRIAGFTIFIVAFFAAAQLEPTDGFLAQLWAHICSSGAEDATQWPTGARQSSAQAIAAPYVWAEQKQVVCPPQPTTYASLPSVTARGDLTVALSLGAGTGVFNNPTLCFVSNSLPAAPVIRIFRGNRLTIKLTNTLINSGPNPTENCTIANYPGRPPRQGQPCSELGILTPGFARP